MTPPPQWGIGKGSTAKMCQSRQNAYIGIKGSITGAIIIVINYGFIGG